MKTPTKGEIDYAFQVLVLAINVLLAGAAEAQKFSIKSGLSRLGVGLVDQLSLQRRNAFDIQKNNQNGLIEPPVFKNQVIQTSLLYHFN